MGVEQESIGRPRRNRNVALVLLGLTLAGSAWACIRVTTYNRERAVAAVLKAKGFAVFDNSEDLGPVASLFWNVNYRVVARMPGALDEETVSLLQTSSAVVSLKLESFQVTQSQWERIAASKCIEELALTGTPLTAGSLVALSTMQSLRDLSIAGTGLTDTDLAVLSKCRRLESVTVDDGQLTERGMDYLCTVKGLRELFVHFTDTPDILWLSKGETLSERRDYVMEYKAELKKRYKSR